jgi:Tripartite ATP-independent periplasmic transporters, DctQ component
MTKIVEAYFHLLKFAIAACLVVMVVLVFGNVFLRYAFNTGLTTSEELSRFFFVWTTFIGAIVALREHGHLGVDLMVKALPAIGKKVCSVLAHLDESEMVLVRESAQEEELEALHPEFASSTADRGALDRRHLFDPEQRHRCLLDARLRRAGLFHEDVWLSGRPGDPRHHSRGTHGSALPARHDLVAGTCRVFLKEFLTNPISLVLTIAVLLLLLNQTPLSPKRQKPESREAAATPPPPEGLA